MNFLSRFKSDPTTDDDAAIDDVPVRRRTFSASQYRDEELARAAEARMAQEAADAEAVAAAEAVRAQRQDDRAADEGDMVAAVPSQPPMDWEEAVGWLSTRSAEARSLVAQRWNWEHDLRVLQFLVTQPDMDMGVAAGVFWLTGATDDFFPWGDDESPADPQFQRAAEIVKALGRRFADDEFTNRSFGFDDSWDCSGLKDRLEALYMDGRITWSPANLPTVSPGPVMSLSNVSDDERTDVGEFLARHGA